MAEPRARRLSQQAVSIGTFLVLAAAVAGIFGYLSEGFLTLHNLKTMLRHVSVTALSALGLTFVIIVGHYSMSFPWIGSLGGMTMGFLIAREFGVATAVAGGLLAGMAWGLLNGLAIGRFKMPDVITTIGTGSIAWGLAYLYSGGALIYDNFLMSGIMQLNDAEWLRVPFPVVMTGALYLAAYVVMHRSVHGRRFYATGDNYVAAVYSGVRVNAYIAVAFVLCAGLGSLATILTNAAQGVGNVKAGIALLMPTYSAVYLGIVVFRRPTIVGTLVGALFISMMLNGFTLLGVPFYTSDLVISLVLITALTLANENVMRALGRGRAALLRREAAP